jgi:cytochrome b
MTKIKVWDPLVRLFHWSLVIFFAANALVLDDDSKWHIWVGYAIVALVLVRIIWGFFGTKYARFTSFPPSAAGSMEQISDIISARKQVHIGHTPLGALMIYNLLVAMLVIGLSGYLMTTDMFWGVEWPEEVHEASVLWAEISVVLHIAAVVFESIRTKVNLPRAMFTGYKGLPIK